LNDADGQSRILRPSAADVSQHPGHQGGRVCRGDRKRRGTSVSPAAIATDKRFSESAGCQAVGRGTLEKAKRARHTKRGRFHIPTLCSPAKHFQIRCIDGIKQA
jgi:hypothetical protein